MQFESQKGSLRVMWAEAIAQHNVRVFQIACNNCKLGYIYKRTYGKAGKLFFAHRKFCNSKSIFICGFCASVRWNMSVCSFKVAFLSEQAKITQRVQMNIGSKSFRTLFLSYAFLYGNFHLFYYLNEVTQYALFFEHLVLSTNYVLKAFCTFLSSKTNMLLVYGADQTGCLDANIY